VLSPSGINFHILFYAGFVKSSGGLYPPFGAVVVFPFWGCCLLMKGMLKKKKKKEAVYCMSMTFEDFSLKKKERKGLDNFMSSSPYSLMPFFNSIPSCSENNNPSTTESRPGKNK
jgi:hypothetical protein